MGNHECSFSTSILWSGATPLEDFKRGTPGYSGGGEEAFLDLFILYFSVILSWQNLNMFLEFKHQINWMLRTCLNSEVLHCPSSPITEILAMGVTKKFHSHSRWKCSWWPHSLLKLYCFFYCTAKPEIFFNSRKISWWGSAYFWKVYRWR